MYIDYIKSPLGLVEFQASDMGITQTIFCGEYEKKVKSNQITEECKKQLLEYFSGRRIKFELPLDPKGTIFQKAVWDRLLNISYGKTVTYQDLAIEINNPKASQAVGGANGRNPISLIIPCHRVIGASGSLTGYAGGIERKLWLLKLEGAKLRSSTSNQKLDIKNVINTRQSKTEFLN
jgi:methylated-DNA-[protein]-cysteine S-methyltransferase